MDDNVLSDTLPETVTQETTPEDEADNTVSGSVNNPTPMTHNQSSKAQTAIGNGNASSNASAPEITTSEVTVKFSNEPDEPKKPLNLLDLPLDILREVVKEVY